MSRKTFKASVTAFIKASPWLTPAHLPAVTSLEVMAEALDAELTAAMVSQFNLAYRNLAREAPPAAPEDDPLEKALKAAGKA